MQRSLLPYSLFPLLVLLFVLPPAWAGPTPASTSSPASVDLGSWNLETLKGSSATLTKGTDGPNGSPSITVEAQTGSSGEKWLVQMDYPLSVRKGKTYHLKFSVKADADRYVFVSCTQLVPPYAILTDGKSLQFSSNWQQLEYDFTPKADESTARILLTNLNDPGAKFYIAAMTLDPQ